MFYVDLDYLVYVDVVLGCYLDKPVLFYQFD